MSVRFDIIVTCTKEVWEEFCKETKHDLVRYADVKTYENSDIVNVHWDWIKWGYEDTRELDTFFSTHSCIYTLLDEEDNLQRHNNIDDDYDLWDYAPSVVLKY